MIRQIFTYEIICDDEENGGCPNRRTIASGQISHLAALAEFGTKAFQEFTYQWIHINGKDFCSNHASKHQL